VVQESKGGKKMHFQILIFRAQNFNFFMQVTNFEEVVSDIKEKLCDLRDTPGR
jgi:hypothetical protein